MFTTIISIFAYFQYKQKRKLYSHYLSINYKYFIALQAFHELSVLAKNLTPLSLIEKLKEWNTNKIHQKNMIQYKRNPCLRLYLWSIPLLNWAIKRTCFIVKFQLRSWMVITREKLLHPQTTNELGHYMTDILSFPLINHNGYQHGINQ